jgi:1,4-dihydroxy-2-naphthoyl-CoA hydrolase
MAIWTKPISTEILTTTHIATAAERLGIEFLEIGPDFIRGEFRWTSAPNNPMA